MGDLQDVFGGHVFDCDDVDPGGEYEPLPAGWYNVQIEDADVVQTKRGDGWVFKLVFCVIDGDYSGRKVFGRLNIVNPSADAQKIAHQHLSALGRATGVMRQSDSSQFIDKLLRIKLNVKNDSEYGPQNNVVGFKAPGAGTAPARKPSGGGMSLGSQKVEPQSSTQANLPPWKRK